MIANLKMLVKFQHTAARRRLDQILRTFAAKTEFQHTAARRRLALVACVDRLVKTVFQHTAARRRLE